MISVCGQNKPNQLVVYGIFSYQLKLRGNIYTEFSKKRVIGNPHTAKSIRPTWQKSDCRFYGYET
jgi:hypothetical protein